MKTLFMFILICFSLKTFSQSRIVSVDAFDQSYFGGLSFKHEEGKKDDQNTTAFKINLNYAQNLPEYVGLMWKAQTYWNRLDRDFGGNDLFISEVGAAGGLVYNLNPDDIKNSALASVMAGLERGTYKYGSSADEAGFNLFLNLEAGKRWDLGSYSVANISYAPTVLLSLKRYGGDIRDHYFKNASEIRINFLKFDILF